MGLVSLLLAWTPAHAFDFGKGELAILENFCTRGGKGQSGSSVDTWELRGSKAVVRGRTYALKTVRLSMAAKDGRVFVVTSPNCVFDQDTGVARSEAPVRIVGEDATIDGVGYDVSMAQRRVRIRSSVHITLRVAGGGGRKSFSLISARKETRDDNGASGETQMKKEKR